MDRQYQSAAMAAIHETALGMREAQVITQKTMTALDEICLRPTKELSPDDIRTIRQREQASQAVFARYLNVPAKLVSQWERGEKHPRGASLKLLTLVAEKGLQFIL